MKVKIFLYKKMNSQNKKKVSTIQVSGTMRDVWGCGYDLPPSLLPSNFL